MFFFTVGLLIRYLLTKGPLMGLLRRRGRTANKPNSPVALSFSELQQQRARQQVQAEEESLTPRLDVDPLLEQRITSRARTS